jgi:ABC-type transport system involved in cytochrome c biogenesis permease subunit
MKKISLIFLYLGIIFAQNIESVLILNKGRIKPLETYYNESIAILYGKSKTKLGDVKRSATETVRYIFENSEDLYKINIFKIGNTGVKESLGLPVDRSFFNYEEITDIEKLNGLISEAIRKAQNEIKMSELEDGYLHINQQLNLFTEIFNLYEYKVIPLKNSDWKTIYEGMQGDISLNYQQGFIKLLLDVKVYQEKILNQEILAKKDYELLYNKVQPFLYSWILLFLSTLFVIIFFQTEKKIFLSLSKPVFIASYLLIITGFILRVFISGRAPVTNMYESVIWVGFAAATLALFNLFSRKTQELKLLPYSMASAMVFIMASDILPNVFDASISPLQPVLRSTFWLTTHVLTITFSYGAFAVSFFISIWGMLRFIIGNDSFQKHLEKANYSALKVGTIFLTLGTLLGAIWADYAWGRFWGWDPKETWAAITLIIYVILLHGRFAGWVKKELNYVYSALGFVSVLTAWYGVNYILGVGLHSYGFSKAGNSWFYYFSGIVGIISILTYLKYKKLQIKMG